MAAARSLRRANSRVQVTAVVKDLVASNAESLLAGADVILDGTDNYETRYLINDVAVKRSIPWIYGAAVGTKGSLMPILPGRTACLACLFDDMPVERQPTCDTAGVLNAVTSLVGSLQAAEALKILAGRAESVLASFVSQDLWTGERSSLRTQTPNPECRTCAGRRFAHLDARVRSTARLCGRDAVQVPGGNRPVRLAELAASLQRVGKVRATEHVLRFWCPPHELMVFADGRTIVKGTHDVGLARSLRTRYVGA